MSQALSTIHSISSLITRSSTSSSKPSNRTPSPCCLNVQMSSSPQNASLDAPSTNNTPSPISRRNIIAIGIASAVLGLSNEDKNNAWAAARRPPAAPTDQEKKDPNVSGVQAKVLASKKRKEAMKQAMAQQRERGKKIDESSNKKIQGSSSTKDEDSSSKKIEEESPEKQIMEGLSEKKINEESRVESSTQEESQS